MSCLLLLIVYFGILYSIYRIYAWWKDRRYRLHLSSLMALTIVAGTLLGLNVAPIHYENQIGWPFFPHDPVSDWEDSYQLSDIKKVDKKREELYQRYWGWPIVCDKPWYWHLDWDEFAVMDVLVLWNSNLVFCTGVIAWTLYFIERRINLPERKL